MLEAQVVLADPRASTEMLVPHQDVVQLRKVVVGHRREEMVGDVVIDVKGADRQALQ